MRQTKRKQSKKNKKIRKTQHRKKRGGSCGCSKPFMKGGYGAASFQPFEQTAGQYHYAQNTFNSDPNMPAAMDSGRLSSAVLHGGKSRRGRRIKKMRGGDFLLGNTSSNLNLSFNTSGGSVSGMNTLTGTPTVNMDIGSQPIGSKFGGNNIPIV